MGHAAKGLAIFPQGFGRGKPGRTMRAGHKLALLTFFLRRRWLARTHGFLDQKQTQAHQGQQYENTQQHGLPRPIQDNFQDKLRAHVGHKQRDKARECPAGGYLAAPTPPLAANQ